MKYLERFNTFFNRLLLVAAGASMLMLMALATANVVLRVFGRPYSGTYELVGFLGALLVALAMGDAQSRQMHIVVDIVSRKYSPALGRTIDVLAYLATLVFFAIVGWRLVVYAMVLRHTHEVSETLKIAFYPIVLCTAVGFAAMVLTLLAHLIRVVAGSQES